MWGWLSAILGIFKDAFVDIFKDAYKSDAIETKVEYAEGIIEPLDSSSVELTAQYKWMHDRG